MTSWVHFSTLEGDTVSFVFIANCIYMQGFADSKSRKIPVYCLRVKTLQWHASNPNLIVLRNLIESRYITKCGMLDWNGIKYERWQEAPLWNSLLHLEKPSARGVFNLEWLGTYDLSGKIGAGDLTTPDNLQDLRYGFIGVPWVRSLMSVVKGIIEKEFALIRNILRETNGFPFQIFMVFELRYISGEGNNKRMGHDRIIRPVNTRRPLKVIF